MIQGFFKGEEGRASAGGEGGLRNLSMRSIHSLLAVYKELSLVILLDVQ